MSGYWMTIPESEPSGFSIISGSPRNGFLNHSRVEANKKQTLIESGFEEVSQLSVWEDL
jgi:hypothetical protein